MRIPGPRCGPRCGPRERLKFREERDRLSEDRFVELWKGGCAPEPAPGCNPLNVGPPPPEWPPKPACPPITLCPPPDACTPADACPPPNPWPPAEAWPPPCCAQTGANPRRIIHAAMAPGRITWIIVPARPCSRLLFLPISLPC